MDANSYYYLRGKCIYIMEKSIVAKKDGRRHGRRVKVKRRSKMYWDEKLIHATGGS